MLGGHEEGLGRAQMRGPMLVGGRALAEQPTGVAVPWPFRYQTACLGWAGWTGRLTQQVHEDRVAQQQREAHECPGQEWCLEGEEAEEVDPHLRAASAPYVHQHGCEGLAQKE